MIIFNELIHVPVYNKHMKREFTRILQK